MSLVPMSAPPRPKVRRKSAKVTTYDLVVGGVPVSYHRVTSICGVLAAPALMNWIAVTNRKSMARLARQLYESLAYSEAINPDAFEAKLWELAGKERADEKILREAGDIGTNVHKYIQWYIHRSMGQWDDVVEPTLHTPEAERAIEYWRTWWDAQEKEPIFVEQRVYNQTYEYAGTEDWKGYINGKLVDLDWKTAGGIYNEALMQNAAYANALPYDNGEYQRSEGGMIVRLPKKAGDVPDYSSPEWCRMLTREEQDTYFEHFLRCRELYRWLEE